MSERELSDTSHIELGFWFACVVMSFMWNIDWPHYIRYWLRSGPPYKRSWELGFRAFFVLSFMSSVLAVITRLFAGAASMRDIGFATIDAVLLISLLATIDGFVRWWLGKPSRGV